MNLFKDFDGTRKMFKINYLLQAVIIHSDARTTWSYIAGGDCILGRSMKKNHAALMPVWYQCIVCDTENMI